MRSISSPLLACSLGSTYFMPAALLFMLAFFCLAKAVSQGVCCADDAYFASVAKNLVLGLGYGSTVNGDGFVLFDAGISTGPVVILPAAGAIAIFGNRPWVPGVVAVMLWSGLAWLVFGAVRKAATDLSPSGLRDAGMLFVVGIPLLFPYHFETWTNLLGEAPAALLLALGFALFAQENLSPRIICLASLACSLAFLSKIVTLPGYVAFLFSVAARTLLVERRGLRATALYLSTSVLAFAAPVIAFELSKLLSFADFTVYVDHLAHKISFARQQGLPSVARPGLLLRMATHDANVGARFGLTVFQFLIAAAAAFAVISRSGQRALLRMAIPIVLTVAMTSTWFLLFSNGWPRYFLITVVLVGGLVSIAVGSLDFPTRLPAAVALLAILCTVNHGKLAYLGQGLEHGLFRPSDELQSAIAVTKLIDETLDQRDPQKKLPLFLTQWWAATADIEYYSAHVNVFKRYTRLGQRDDFIIVYNRRFVAAQDDAFEQLCSRCKAAESDPSPHVVLCSAASGLPRSQTARRTQPSVVPPTKPAAPSR